MNNNLKVKHLITESDLTDYTVVKESTKDGGNILKLQGQMIICETLNNNNRKYHLDEMVEEVRKYQDVINSHRALGELEHPDDITINPDRVCCRLLKLEQDKHNELVFNGEALIMGGDPQHGIPGTPCGTIVSSLIQYGTKMGFSTRGLGNPEEDENGDTYVSDFSLICIDCVLDPSIGKFCDAKQESRAVHGILESIEYLVDSNNLVVESRVVDNFKKSLKNLPNDSIERYLKLKNTVDSFLKGI